MVLFIDNGKLSFDECYKKGVLSASNATINRDLWDDTVWCADYISRLQAHPCVYRHLENFFNALEEEKRTGVSDDAKLQSIVNKLQNEKNLTSEARRARQGIYRIIEVYIARDSAIVIPQIASRYKRARNAKVKRFIKKHGREILGVSGQTGHGFKTNALPLAAGTLVAGYAWLTGSFSPTETPAQEAVEMILAFCLPATDVSLIRNFIAKPSLGRGIKNTLVGATVLGTSIIAVQYGVKEGLLPDNSAFLNGLRHIVGKEPVANKIDPVLVSGSVEATHDGVFFGTADLDKGGPAKGFFYKGQRFCVTLAVTGDKPTVQVPLTDGDFLYATNIPGFFKLEAVNACAAAAPPPPTPAPPVAGSAAKSAAPVQLVK